MIKKLDDPNSTKPYLNKLLEIAEISLYEFKSLYNICKQFILIYLIVMGLDNTVPIIPQFNSRARQDRPK